MNKIEEFYIQTKTVLIFLMVVFLVGTTLSCGSDHNPKNYRSLLRSANPIDTSISKGSIIQDVNINTVQKMGIDNLDIKYSNFESNDPARSIKIKGLTHESKLVLHEGSCSGEEFLTLSHNGTWNFEIESNRNEEKIFFAELIWKEGSECKQLEKSFVHLKTPQVSLDELATSLDKRRPQFRVSDLFLSKDVTVSLHQDPSCLDAAVSDLVQSRGSSYLTVPVTSNLLDTGVHTYYAKQKYKGVYTCSSAIDYSYSIDVDNLGLAYDNLISGLTPSGISVTKILEGSSVSLHKGSCLTFPDDSINQDGILTPEAVLTNAEFDLYLKYSFQEQSDCRQLATKYINLARPLISLNQDQTSLHKQHPSFDVSGLFAGKNVSVVLYEDSDCSLGPVSALIQTSNGSTTLTVSPSVTDSNTHTYYVKETYRGYEVCSEGADYTYGLSISDLTIVSDPILYGSTPSGISVSGMIEGSTVSLHKGSCNAITDSSITEDGTITPSAVATNIESDIYLKYTYGLSSSCRSIGVKYINLSSPTLSLNASQTALDKRSPKFDASNLFTGKTVNVSLHTDSSCSSDPVSAVIPTSLGSTTLGLSSIITDTQTHSYYLKQTYMGFSSCSNVLNYKYDIDVSNLSLTYNPVVNGKSPSVISVQKLLDGSSVSLHKGSCETPADDSISSDGTLTPSVSNSYIETDLYLKYSKGLENDCKKLDTVFISLEPAVLSLNVLETNVDKRYPKFNATNLFNGKNVTLTLHSDSGCTSSSLSSEVQSSNGSSLIGVSSALTDISSHSYYLKQSYLGLSSCSSVVNYSYELDVDNLALSYDSILYGSSPSSVSVSKMLSGSTVSLHKGSCGSAADTSIDSDGSLTPAVVNTYSESDLFIKYSFNETSDCKAISSKYLNLEQGVLTLNSAHTALHKRTPTFDVSNLFSGKNVSIALYENSTCSGGAVSSEEQTDTGSGSLTLSSDIDDNNTHSYYVKQSYLGHFSCSAAAQYTYGLDIEDLTISSDPVLYGSTPGSISVSGMIPGSTVSIHKGSCEALADDSISEDGSLTPTAVDTYIESTIYLKYSLNGGSTCSTIGVSYINLQSPQLSLNVEQTALDKRSPKFNATNLFTGKEVSLTLHESSDCSGAAVSGTINSDTGSSLIGLSSNLIDLVSHSYSLKQTYSGVTSCSNSIAYQYEINTSNLGISADELLFGATPGSVTVSKMISGSTVSLHKGSCGAAADASINADGSLTPTSTGSYNYSQIYIKYTKGGSSDCDPIGSYYLYLEQPTLTLNSAQTDLHPLTPTFNVTNLFSGKNVTVQLYEDSSCSLDPVSTSTSTDTGSASLTLQSSLADSNSHNYYAKQTYLGRSTCSLALAYQFSADSSDLTLTYDPVLYGSTPSGIAVSGMVTGSSVSLYKGNNCLGVADSTINADGTIYPTAANSYTESDIYIKYSFSESSTCSKLDTSYIYLENPVITLAAPLADARTPSYNVSNLFTGKSVSVSLYESTNCSGAAVSSNVVSATGSTVVTKSSVLSDLNSHSFSVKQSYNGVTSCSNSLSYQYSIDTSNLGISVDAVLYGSTPGSVTVSKMIAGSTVSLHKGSCLAAADDSINADGTLTPDSASNYTEENLYIKYTFNETSDCDAISSKYLYLENPVISLNSASTATDPRYPVFNVSNLYSGKSKTISLYNGSSCTGSVVRAATTTTQGSTTITPSSALTTTSSYNYSVKQSYLGHSTCSNAVAYQYQIDTENLVISADELLYGTTPGSVSVSHMLSGSTVSLHKGSCGAAADTSINADGTLTPSSTGSYNYSQLYIKYTKGGSSDCDAINSYYLYLERPTLSLNSAQTESHPLIPTLDVSNLFTGKTVTVQLFEDSGCSSSPVSSSTTSSTGSTTLSVSSQIEEGSSHTYYVKQTYLDRSTCSTGVGYSLSLDAQDLTVTTSITNGVLNASVEGGYVGSTVSLHKGACNVASSDSASFTSGGQTLNLSVSTNSSYTYQDVYLKYTLNESEDCRLLDKKLTYLVAPTLALATPLSDKRIPVFNITGLYSGQTVTVQVFESSNCTGSTVTTSSTTNSGSRLLGKSFMLTDLNSHTYSAKQTFNGISSCSNSISYQYQIDTENLIIVADELLYGATPGSVSVSHVISGSTVSLHKGSCGASADASINADGTLTPTSTGSYNYSQLYIKYTKGGSTDCDAISSYYLYLERPTLALNASQTESHPLTPSFNIGNLFSGKTVTVQLFENSTCSSSAVSTSTTSSTGSTTLTLSSSINDGATHTYYAKQTYQGQSTCSLGVSYSVPVDTEDLTVTTSITNGVLNASVEGGYVGSTVSLHKGACNAASSDSASFTSGGQTLNLSVSTNSAYTYQDVYLKYTLNESSDCMLLDKKLTYLVAPTLALATPLSDKRIPVFNITGLYSGKSVTVVVYESTNCTGSTVTGSSSTSTGSKSLTKSSALTDISSHSYSAKQTFNGVSSCSNSISYQYSIDVDNLTVSAPSLLYGSTPGSITVSKMLSGSTVSLLKGSCGASADTSINADGSLTPTVPGTNQEVALYLKYSFNTSTDCQSLSSTYLYLAQPNIALDAAETATHKTTPTFNVTNLFSGKSVTATLHTSSDCSDAAKSSSVVTNTGSTSLTLSSPLGSFGTFGFYAKQTYSGYSTCSSVVNYTYKELQYLSSIADYTKVRYWGVDQNRGIAIKGTTFGNSVKVYEGNACNNEGNLLASSTTTHDVTLVHIPTLTDGVHSFCFKELDPSSNVLGTYTTGSITYKTPAIYRNSTDFIYMHDNTLDFFATTNYPVHIYKYGKAPKQVFSSYKAFAVLHEDGSVTTYGDAGYGGDSSSVAASLTSGVVKIFSNYYAFAAVKSNGSVVVWGDTAKGGSLTSPINVSSSLTSGVVRIYSNWSGFAALKSDGSVVSWGDSELDATSVSSSLSSGVVTITPTWHAFAAIKSNGSVVTWGEASQGGSMSSPVNAASSLTSGVVSITATYASFAAIKTDGSVVTWGDSGYGGNSSSVASSLTSGVVKIVANDYVFAAIKSDGSVVTWLIAAKGGDQSSAASQLSSGVVDVTPNLAVMYGSFAALKSDGSVVSWGESTSGGDSSSVSSQISSGVTRVLSTDRAFAALKSNGSVVAWGNSANGGSLGAAASALDGTVPVVDLIGNTHSFMALRSNGTVVVWGTRSYLPVKIDTTDAGIAVLSADGSVTTYGEAEYGGDSSSVASQISSGVVDIVANLSSFAAIKADGSVVTWGNSSQGGDSSSVASSLTSGVVSVTGTIYAFAALKSNGSVVTWGVSGYGGNSSSVASQISSGVVKVYANVYSFAALKSDGSVVTWGDSYGGNSSSVASQLSSGVVKIFSCNTAFAALKSDGSVVNWGDNRTANNTLTSGVVDIVSGGWAFTAVKSDGSAVAWGMSSNGGDASAVASELTSGVIAAFSTGYDFVALKSDGSVVAWGGTTPPGGLSGVVDIASTWSAYAALKSDGSVVTWGGSSGGGDSSSVASSLSSGVVNIFSSGSRFVALKSDGSIVGWGNSAPAFDALAASYKDGTNPVSLVRPDGTATVIVYVDGTHVFAE